MSHEELHDVFDDGDEEVWYGYFVKIIPILVIPNMCETIYVSKIIYNKKKTRVQKKKEENFPKNLPDLS